MAEKRNLDDLSNSQVIALIDEWIRGETERKILKMRLIDLKTIKEIAETVDYSEQYTKKMLYKSQNRLFKHIL